jgi:hypothetical protein
MINIEAMETEALEREALEKEPSRNKCPRVPRLAKQPLWLFPRRGFAGRALLWTEAMNLICDFFSGDRNFDAGHLANLVQHFHRIAVVNGAIGIQHHS